MLLWVISISQLKVCCPFGYLSVKKFIYTHKERRRVPEEGKLETCLVLSPLKGDKV